MNKLISKNANPVDSIPIKAEYFFLASNQGVRMSKIGKPTLGLRVRKASMEPPKNHFSLCQNIAADVIKNNSHALNWPPSNVVVVGRKMILARIIGKRRCLEYLKFCARKRNKAEIMMKNSDKNVHAMKAVLRGNAPNGERRRAKGRG